MISFKYVGGVMELVRLQKMEDLTSSQRFLLLVLSSFSNKHGECYPSQKTLAVLTGLTRRTINSGINSLQEKGYITSHKRKSEEGDLTTNLYRIKIKPKLPSPGDDKVVHFIPKGADDKFDRSWAENMD